MVPAINPSILVELDISSAVELNGIDNTLQYNKSSLTINGNSFQTHSC